MARTNDTLSTTGMGAAYGTAKSGIGIAGVATFRPDLIMKCLIPVVMSGIIAVYALVISVLIAQDMGPPSQGGRHYSLFECGRPLLFSSPRGDCLLDPSLTTG